MGSGVGEVHTRPTLLDDDVPHDDDDDRDDNDDDDDGDDGDDDDDVLDKN